MSIPFSSRPRVLDIDGSVARQSDFVRQSGASIQGLESWGPRLRYICRRQTRQSFERRLNGTDSHRLTFYGSGDFHHLTLSLLKFHWQPLSVVVFDQHPDWDVTSPWPCCGTWVNEALMLPQVERVIVIGAGREDLGGIQLWRGNRAALSSGRLEIFPATLSKSVWPGARHAMACGMRANGRMKWQTVQRLGMRELLDDVIARLPTKRVYVSVDKDCLTSAFAASNWDAGELSLTQVCEGIRQLREKCQLVGGDVTGEWSSPRIQSRIVAAISRADHPRKLPLTSNELRENERTNLALWQAFGGELL